MTTREIPDTAARRAILCAHDRTLLVEAGAGSGKTALMAGRVALLLAGGTPAKSIVAITFTKAAAAELFERIERYVHALAAGVVPKEIEVGLADGLSTTQIAALERARGELDELTCTTIHSFCQQIIRPYPIETGLDPGAAVADALQTKVLRREMTTRWLRRRLAEENDPAEDIFAAFAAYDVDTLLSFVDDAAGMIVQYPVEVDIPPPPAAVTEALAQALNDFIFWYNDLGISEEKTALDVDELRALLSEIEDYEAAPHAVTTLFRRLTYPKLAASVKDAPRFRLWRRKTAWSNAAKAAGLTKATGEAISGAGELRYADCSAAYVQFVQGHAAHLFALCVREMQAFREVYQAEKRQRSLIDFDDFLVTARDLVRKQPQILATLATRYTHILVDEFQDTDPIQAEILWYLCGVGAPDEPWQSRRIRDGSLFLVGDPKQAIYGFRGADIAIYRAAKQAILAHTPEALMHITANFRSHAAIMDFVNRTFEPLLDEKRDQPGFVALTALTESSIRDDTLPAIAVIPVVPQRPDEAPIMAADDAPAVVPGDELNAPAPVTERRNIHTLRVREAQAVAQAARAMIGHVRIYDRHAQHERPARAGDIALLAGRTSDLWIYEQALEELHIPLATQAGKNFYGRQEVQDLVAVARAIADPRDTFALGAVLRGPLVGLAERELADLYTAWPTTERPLSILTPPADIEFPPVRAVFEKIHVLRRSAETSTPYRTMALAIDLFDLRTLIRLRDVRAVERSFANLERVLQLATAYETRGFAAFARNFAHDWAHRDMRESEGVPDARENAVHILTIHAAKGLEWPIVIPVNAITDWSKTRRDTFYYDAATRRLAGKIAGVADAHVAELQAAKLERETRELTRLWYVALTRARDHLFFPQITEPSPSDLFAILECDISGLPLLQFSEERSARSAPSADDFEAEVFGQTPCELTQHRAIFAAESERIRQNAMSLSIEQPSRHAESDAANGAADSADKPAENPFDEDLTYDNDLTSNDDLAYDNDLVYAPFDLGLPVVQRPQADDRQAGDENGTLRGILIHKLLEECVTGETEIDTLALQSRALELAKQVTYTLTISAATLLAENVQRVFALPQIQALRNRLEAEVPLLSLTSKPGGAVMTIGVIDALARDAAGNIEYVIDWKSDREPTSRMLAHYTRQVGRYLAIAQASTGYIVFLETGQCVQVAGQSQSPLSGPA
jgi:exodeoxyribonuclease-5